MVEDCYILYSCDGSYEPIISNFSGLSANTSSYVNIEILDLSITADTCFYVLSLGKIDCDPTYDITIVSGDCNCLCYCYFIRSATETTNVTYVNCDDQITIDTIQEGLTYNICSKTYPKFDTITQIPIKLTDICENGQCPPTIPTVKPPNECDVITIFPMGVDCIVQNPTNDRTFDGAAALSITGGTPPYTVFWEIGSFAPALANIGVGQYSATVVDYYGDFSSNTICVLTAETQILSAMCFVVSGIVKDQLVYINSPSIGLKNGRPHYFLQYGLQELGYVFWNESTQEWYFCQTIECQTSPYNILNYDEFYPTGTTGSWVIAADTEILIQESYIGPCQIPVIPKSSYDLCVSLEVIDYSLEIPAISVVQIDLQPGLIINGEESWTSSTSQYLLYWNTGSTPSQWTLTGYSSTTVFINNDPSYPPLSNWQILGSPSVVSITVREGSCVSSYSVSVGASDNDAVCGGFGSISVTAAGGTPPYTFSVDGGLSYQPSPMFNNLLPGIYSVTAKDSNSIVGTFGNVTITNTPPTTYTLTLNVNYVNNTFSITAPTLPGGVTFTVNLVMISTLSYYPISLNPSPSYNNTTTIDGSYTMNFISITTNTIPLTGPCTADGAINIIQYQRTYERSITFVSNQTVTGSTSNFIINQPIGYCEDAIAYYTINMNNPIVNGCSCCELLLINPVTPKPISF